MSSSLLIGVSSKRPDDPSNRFPTAWFPSIDAAEGHIVERCSTDDVYVRTTPVIEIPNSGRGKASDAAALVGLWADVDIAHEVHQKSKTLPRTEDAARAIIDRIPLKPTLIIHSGHGLQPWWLFYEPILFASSRDRDDYAKISKEFGIMLQAHADREGNALDSVHDLARVMRVWPRLECSKFVTTVIGPPYLWPGARGCTT